MRQSSNISWISSGVTKKQTGKKDNYTGINKNYDIKHTMVTRCAQHGTLLRYQSAKEKHIRLQVRFDKQMLILALGGYIDEDY